MAHPPRDLVRSEGGKIGLLVIDGLGGLPHGERGLSELEQAHLPNLDDLARRSSVGRVQLLPTGLTPGSGPGHLSLFGYDPMTLEFGRGLLEALGSDYPLSGAEDGCDATEGGRSPHPEPEPLEPLTQGRPRVSRSVIRLGVRCRF